MNALAPVAIAAAISVGCGAAPGTAAPTAVAATDTETVVVTAAAISVEGNVVAYPPPPSEATHLQRLDALAGALRARRGSGSVCEPALRVRIDPDVPWHFAQSAILTAALARCTTLRIRTGQREVTIRVPDPNLEALPPADAARLEVQLAERDSEVRVVAANPPGPKPGDATTPPMRSKRLARGDPAALRAALVETCTNGALSTCFEAIWLGAEPTMPFADVAKALVESAVTWKQPAEPRTPPLVELRSKGMNPELIQRIVRRQFGALRRCYEAGLRIDPTLTGRVDMRFVIQRDGMVKEASMVSKPEPRDAPPAGPSAEAVPPMPDAEVVRCLTKVFEALRFPTPESTVVVVYPIVFSPAEPSEAPKK